MRCVHLADLHLTEGPRLEDQTAVLRDVVEQARDLKPDLWLLAGDLYGRTVPHRSTPAEREVLVRAIAEMVDDAPVVIVTGNHDYPGDLRILESLGGRLGHPVLVAEEARILPVTTRRGLAQVYCLPYPTKRWLLAGETEARGVEATRLLVLEKLQALVGLWARRVERQTDRVHLGLAHVQVGGARTSGGEMLAGQEVELAKAWLYDLPVAYGALGHIHLAQQPVERWWYAGSPWRNDFAEVEDHKTWAVIDVGPSDPRRPLLPSTVAENVYPGDPLRPRVHVALIPTRCRRMVTLDYRWAQVAERDGQPVLGWHLRPEPAVLATCADAEVRMRLVVPQQWVAGCPWELEVEGVRMRGAHRVVVERTIEPVLRVRAPEVAAAAGHPERLSAYWRTLGTQPTAAESAAALALLNDLLTLPDETITATTNSLTR